jgi:phenylpropionate dioxygenase-like ring-hydroxylating dioxygenase large terminal subunit
MESTFIIDDRDAPRFRVHRSALSDPEVLAAERARIFDMCWLYVGHESEIPAAHDFRTRSVGGRPVIFTRNAEGEVRVFVNSCPHRGMAIELRPEGHGRFLKCFYHGWSFSTDGDLVAMPDDASYGPCFDRRAMGLVRPPMVDSYRGFVFLRWRPDNVDLGTYLGHARDYLDLVADQSPHGMQIVGGTHLYSMRANWKLLVENSIDGYHALTTHQRYLEMLKASGKSSQAMFRAPAVAIRPCRWRPAATPSISGADTPSSGRWTRAPAPSSVASGGPCPPSRPARNTWPGACNSSPIMARRGPIGSSGAATCSSSPTF